MFANLVKNEVNQYGVAAGFLLELIICLKVIYQCAIKAVLADGIQLLIRPNIFRRLHHKESTL